MYHQSLIEASQLNTDQYLYEMKQISGDWFILLELNENINKQGNGNALTLVKVPITPCPYSPDRAFENLTLRSTEIYPLRKKA